MGKTAPCENARGMQASEIRHVRASESVHPNSNSTSTDNKLLLYTFTPHTATTRKMKFLCLHGTYGSAEVSFSALLRLGTMLILDQEIPEPALAVHQGGHQGWHRRVQVD